MDLLLEHTFLIIALGTSILGAASGILGSFAVLRNQSLLGDTISHAALPGIVLMFLFTGEKSSDILLLGAILMGILGAFWMNDIVKNTRLKTDAAMGIVLSVLFGFGMVLLTYVQHSGDANQAGLDKYLFGQATTLMESDIYTMLLFLIPALLLVALVFKEIKLVLFDKEYAETLNVSVSKIDLFLTLLIVVNIVMGLQTVGVVLMSSLLLAPAVAARQWTNSLLKMLILAALIGGFSGFLGTWVSAQESHLPTGPVIVIIVSVVVLFSMLFAPNRGMVYQYLKNKKNQKSHA